MTSESRRWTQFTDGLVVSLASLVGLVAGLRPLKDNSAFTHLATGMHMVARSWIPAIPRVDPYSYTAAGHEWVVQSWLPSYVVGVLDRLFGLHAVVVLSGLAALALAGLLAALARTGRPLLTAGAALVALIVSVPSWAPRPLMAGLVFLALTALLAERHRQAWWLVPIGWLWVQSHGSFPLGIAYLAAVALGAWLDGGRTLSVVRDRLVLVGALVAGVVLGALNPLGPKLVVFPLTALSKRNTFQHVAEWKPLDFDTNAGALAVLGLAIALAVCLRVRAPWRVWVPLVLFGALAFSAQRNIAPLGVVVAASLGVALRGDLVARPPLRVPSIVVVASLVACAALIVSAWRGPALRTNAYPVAAIRWVEDHGRFGTPNRVLTRDFVGNYLELRRGPRAEVFMDDRVDMFPESVSADYLSLLRATDATEAILQRWHVDTVVWDEDSKLVRKLRALGWRTAYVDRRSRVWVVLITPSP